MEHVPAKRKLPRLKFPTQRCGTLKRPATMCTPGVVVRCVCSDEFLLASCAAFTQRRQRVNPPLPGLPAAVLMLTARLQCTVCNSLPVFTPPWLCVVVGRNLAFFLLAMSINRLAQSRLGVNFQKFNSNAIAIYSLDTSELSIPRVLNTAVTVASCILLLCCLANRQRGDETAGCRQEDNARLRFFAVAVVPRHRLLQHGPRRADQRGRTP